MKILKKLLVALFIILLTIASSGFSNVDDLGLDLDPENFLNNMQNCLYKYGEKIDDVRRNNFETDDHIYFTTGNTRISAPINRLGGMEHLYVFDKGMTNRLKVFFKCAMKSIEQISRINNPDFLLEEYTYSNDHVYVFQGEREDIYWVFEIYRNDEDPELISNYTNCDPNYARACIPIVSYDLDCSDIPNSNFRIVGKDKHFFDGDYNRIACEPYVP